MPPAAPDSPLPPSEQAARLAANQARTFLALLRDVLPHARSDRSLPVRIQQRIAGEKRFGSRDRRLYRELLYTAIRYLPWIERRLAVSDVEAANAVAWLARPIPATQALRAGLVSDWPETPATIAAQAAHLGEDPAALLPAWFLAHCPELADPALVNALQARAPLWLRLQTDDIAPVEAEFAQRGWPVTVSPLLVDAWRISDDVDITQSDAYLRGAVEVQDLGSQLLLHTAALPSGGRWLDACAGAGGKTLQLARLLGPGSRIDAHDVRVKALDELGLRARRAGVANVRTLTTPPSEPIYDGVLVDAPCSGSGTWRRSPHLKWCTTPAMVTEAAALQQRILTRYAPCVRPGGLLLYATCSLSRVENEDVVTAFLASHPGFTPEAPRQTYGGTLAQPAGLRLLPHQNDTDGFFVAALRRSAAP